MTRRHIFREVLKEFGYDDGQIQAATSMPMDDTSVDFNLESDADIDDWRKLMRTSVENNIRRIKARN